MNVVSLLSLKFILSFSCHLSPLPTFIKNVSSALVSLSQRPTWSSLCSSFCDWHIVWVYVLDDTTPGRPAGGVLQWGCPCGAVPQAFTGATQDSTQWRIHKSKMVYPQHAQVLCLAAWHEHGRWTEVLAKNNIYLLVHLFFSVCLSPSPFLSIDIYHYCHLMLLVFPEY